MKVYGVNTFLKYDGDFRLFSNFTDAKNFAFYLLFVGMYAEFPFVYEKDEVYSTEMKIYTKYAKTCAKLIVYADGKIVTTRRLSIHEIEID